MAADALVLDERYPRTVTELRRDLRAGTARCERRVYVGSFARLSGRVDVVGPPTASGHALVVYLRTGMTRLNVTGGRVSRATPAAYRAALSPVKAFRTRQCADFEIMEV